MTEKARANEKGRGGTRERTLSVENKEEKEKGVCGRG